MKKNFYFFSVILITSVILDIFTKFLVRKNLDLNESLPLIKNILHITKIHNTGAVWGILQNNNIFFIIISIIVLSILIYYFQDLAKSKASVFFLAFIFSGAIGNLIDRILFGFVIDFIDFRIWPVFNIADSALIIGIIGIIFLNLTNKDDKNKQKR